MEVNKDKHDPESNFDNLVQQVEEQSEFCDATVRSGEWKKKFHKCVLSASVLFQIYIAARTSEIEKGDGDAMTCALPEADLEVKIDTSPDIVEMAIMSMYGVTPDFSIENIDALLELAEYLRLRELRDECVDWIQYIDYSEVNCMYIIRLSKKHQFEITPCMEYIESHIPEIIQHADAVDLPAEFVEHLFTDVKFSYVDMDEKLHFLVILANKCRAGWTKEWVVKLFKTIDLKRVSEPAWEHAENDVNFREMVNLKSYVRVNDQENSNSFVMLIPSPEGYFACLDLQNDRWYRVNLSCCEEDFYSDHTFLGIRNNRPELYLKHEYFDYDDVPLLSADFESDQVRDYRFEIEIEGVDCGEIIDIDNTHINFTNNTLIAIVKKTIQKIDSSDSSESESESESENESESESERHFSYQDEEQEYADNTNEDFQARVSTEEIQSTRRDNASCMVQTPGIGIDEPSTSSSRLSASASPKDDKITITDVYIGNALDEDEDEENEVEMKPMFSFRKEIISQICVNDFSVLALLTKAGGFMYVILYDLLQSKMERSLSIPEGEYELRATDNGFLLHNDSQCYCLKMPSETIYSGHYMTEIFMLENKTGWFVKYFYQGGFWMRILRRSMFDDFELQYISHDELKVSITSNDVNWRIVSMPKEDYLYDRIKSFNNVFICPLPKKKLRCNIACPHCKYLYN